MRKSIERKPVQVVRWHAARYGPWLAVVAVISLVLTACGGGNGGGSSY